MSAVDISPDPIPALLHYIVEAKFRYVHFSTSQSDNIALPRIVQDELADELELVVDDASHAYEETKASFEILFPMLQPGGIYVIEDWAWAHNPAQQSADSPRARQKALSNLLFEQIMLTGSTALVAEIRVLKPLYMIRKAASAPPLVSSEQPGSIFDQILCRRRTFTPI